MKRLYQKFYSFLIILALLCVNTLTISAASQTVKVKDMGSVYTNVLYGVFSNMQLVGVELENDSNIEQVIAEFKKPSGKVIKVYLTKDDPLLEEKLLVKTKESSLKGIIQEAPNLDVYIGIIMNEDFTEVGKYELYRVIAVDKNDKQYITEREDLSSFMLEGTDFNVVDKLVKLQGVTLDKTKLVVDRNTTKELYATIAPADAYYSIGAWGTSAQFEGIEETNPVVTVKGSGKRAKVTGVNPGQTKVIFAPLITNYSAECSVIVPGIALDSKKVSIKNNKTLKLAPKVYTKDGLKSIPVTYTTSNSNIAKVDKKGVITGVNKGTALITLSAKYGENTYTTKVTVTVAKSVTGIQLDRKTMNLKTGQKSQLFAKVNPTDANNKSVKWSTSNAKVAKVDAKGVVTAQAPGKVVITATTVDGKLTAKCTVTVIQSVKGIKLNKTKLTLKRNKKAKLTATVMPYNATNKNVIWSSSKTRVVSVDQKGNITAKKRGTATITVTSVDGKYKAYCQITVK